MSHVSGLSTPNREDRVGKSDLGKILIILRTRPATGGIGGQIIKAAGAEEIFQNQPQALEIQQLGPDLDDFGREPAVGEGQDKEAVGFQETFDGGKYFQGPDEIFHGDGADDGLKGSSGEGDSRFPVKVVYQVAG